MLHFANSVRVLLLPNELWTLKGCEMGPTVFHCSLFINLAYRKDISKVWSGSLTPGRVLSRVYRYLFYMSNNMMDEQNTAGEKNLYVLILQTCLLPDTKIKQKCSDPCFTHYTHNSIILWNSFKTMNTHKLSSYCNLENDHEWRLALTLGTCMQTHLDPFHQNPYS